MQEAELYLPLVVADGLRILRLGGFTAGGLNVNNNWDNENNGVGAFLEILQTSPTERLKALSGKRI